MAGIKVTDLPVLGAAAPDDVMYIVDTSTNTSKQIAVEDISSYKVYTALLTQTGTDAPTINVLQNTTGITFTASYDDVGAYILTPDVAPDDDKVTVLGVNGSGSGYIRAMFWRLGVANISTADVDDAPVNGVLSNSTIEIRVYP
jgi:hypothetical protein